MGCCPTAKQINNYWVNDGPKAVLVVLWALGNLALIGERVYCTSSLLPLFSIEIYIIMFLDNYSWRGSGIEGQ